MSTQNNIQALDFCRRNNHPMEKVSGPAPGYVLGWGCDRCGRSINDMRSLDLPRFHCADCKVDLCEACYALSAHS